MYKKDFVTYEKTVALSPSKVRNGHCGAINPAALSTEVNGK